MTTTLDTRPSIKSAWPTPIGKKLTDNKISRYKKKGYYATNLSEPSNRDRKNAAQQRARAFLSEFA